MKTVLFRRNFKSNKNCTNQSEQTPNGQTVNTEWKLSGQTYLMTSSSPSAMMNISRATSPLRQMRSPGVKMYALILSTRSCRNSGSHSWNIVTWCLPTHTHQPTSRLLHAQPTYTVSHIILSIVYTHKQTHVYFSTHCHEYLEKSVLIACLVYN